jgi:hypothetical protein
MNNPQPWWLTMPPAELAARVLPLFASSSHVEEGSALKAVASWLATGSYRLPWAIPGTGATWFENPDTRVAAEAIQVLDRAGLLMRIIPTSSSGSYIGLTRLGWHALQTNTVRRHLGLGDTPPTA